MAAPKFIYHIVCLSDWETQKSQAEFTATSLEAEGFIHCSREEQIKGTLKRFFKNRKDLRILKIDTSLLNVPVIYEAADDGSGFFPHVFGTITMRAIAGVELPSLQKI
jgi:uncharacterized protein (DUF952 family)